MILPPVRRADADSARELLTALVSIPSVNPAYDPASPGENALGDAILEWTAGLGLEGSRAPVVDGRQNIRARLAASRSERTLLIEGHLDTVGLSPGSGTQARVERGRLHGRGACDTKGGIAAALLAIAELAERGLERTDVVLLGAIDEELAFRGITAAIAGGERGDAAIVLEPTDLAIVTEHNGVLRSEILVTGRAAHTSRPEEGRNAIVDALEVVRALEEWIARDTLEGDDTGRILAVTTIAGGSAINIVPDSCRLGVDLRIRPAEHPEGVLDELHGLLASLPVDARVDRVLLADGGLSTAPTSRVVLAAQRAAGLHQLPVETVRVPYGTDGSKLARAGIPTVVFGPGSIADAHGDEESVALDDVVTAARVIRDLVLALEELA